MTFFIVIHPTANIWRKSGKGGLQIQIRVLLFFLFMHFLGNERIKCSH